MFRSSLGNLVTLLEFSPRKSSDLSCICSTTASSIARLPVISTSCWSLPTTLATACCPQGGFVNRSTALRRADAVVLTSGASPDAFPLGQQLVWKARRGIVPVNVPAKPVVFCGIARPKNFVAQLRTAGIEPVAEAFYRDHHAYAEQDVRDLLNLRQRSEADGFVTTEKDAINLGGYLAALEPLAVVPVKMELADAANAVDTMLAMIAERRRKP